MSWPSKKNVVKQLVINENIEILCLQETEIVPELEASLLSFPCFEYETKNHSTKARVGCYIKSGIKYMRCIDLEGINSHLLIIDISAERNLRLIKIYQNFLSTKPNKCQGLLQLPIEPDRECFH
jgi:hypothetical protein